MKLYRVILALFAVSALSAVVVTSASAETTLGAEWLANGNAIATPLATVSAGQFLMEDNGASGEPSMLCSAILVGTVGANGTDEVTEILNLKEEAISLTPLTGLALVGTGTGTDCVTEKVCAEGTAASPIEVWPVGLGVRWETLLFTMENGEILDLVNGNGGGTSTFGFELLCLTGGLDIVDTCTSTDSEILVENDPEGGDAALLPGTHFEPLLTCTLSGNKATAIFEPKELVEIRLVSGELLTVDAL
jgi:hypothetical protein